MTTFNTFNTTTLQPDFIDAGIGNDTVSSVFAELQQNDTINGGDGIDTLIITGGSAEDTINIDVSDITNQLDIDGTKVTGFEHFDLSNFTGEVIFNGTTGNDWIESGNEDDVLSGDNGDDYLNGGAGTDALIGGKGNDTYVVDNLGDIVHEFLNGGIDTIRSSVTWTLKANLENLILVGTDIINGTGNKLNNTLTGNVADNQLSGNAGNDTLIGSTGNDTLNGGEGNDTADYSQLGQSITLSPTGIITKRGVLEDDQLIPVNDQLIQVETIIADASAVNNTIDVSTAGNAASINVNLQTQQLTINGVGTFTVTNFDHVQGTSQNDTIIGDTQNNQLSGNAGNDTIFGGTGNDTLNGGEGNDTADYSQLGQSITLSPTGIITKGGGLGNDQLIEVETIIADASAVNNTIDAGNAASINVNLQTQQLTINGVKTLTVTNFDHVQGTSQDDSITGDTQDNQLSGNAGNDTIAGNAGNDTIFGGAGNDTISGDDGNDTADYSQIGQSITLSPTGIITKSGGLGNDQLIQVETIIADASAVNNTIDVSTAGNAASINVNLQTQQLTINGVGTLTVTNFDHVQGTSQDDTIIGDTQNNQLSGNAGNDTIFGGAGNDTISGDYGYDTADYSQLGQSITLSTTGIITKGGRLGNDQLIQVETIIADASAVNNTIDGSTAGNAAAINVNLQTQQLTINGVETLTVSNFDHVQGTSQDDSIAGDTQNNQLSGNAGNDILIGSTGNDTLNGGEGNDTADYSQIGQGITLSPTGIITKGGGLGNDQLIEVETIIADASAVNNTIDVSTAGNAASINVNLQTQQLTINGVGTFTVTNFDHVQGTSQNDSITGDTQDNQLSGNAGNDTIFGGTGNDTISGDYGYDTADYSQIGQSITLSPTGIITKGGGLGNDQLIGVETIIADASAVNNTIDGSTAGNAAAINVNLQTQQLTINGVGTLTVTNFDHVQGTSQNDSITGDTQENQLSGNAGNDTIFGGAGNDTISGDYGYDTADYSQLGQSITLSPTGIITKGGGLGNDQLIQVETIIADASAVDNTIDASMDVIYYPYYGYYYAYSSINVNLQTQQLTINGLGTFTVTNFHNVQGTSQDDSIAGDTQNNHLSGNAGNDILICSTGNDTLNGGEGNDTADYSQIGQSITLSPTGIITKGGGLGNDQLIQVETIIADASAVNNTVDLSAYIGNYVYTYYGYVYSSISVNLQTQQLTINGVETLTVTNFDNVQGTSQDDSITGDTQNNQLSGNAGNDTLDGGDGNDTLDGGDGSDALIGGTGDDIYIVDSTTDIITENANEGIDIIQSSVTYTMATNVENLTLTGTTAINCTGNDVNNIIVGNSYNNVIMGNAGNDTLDGGDGSDALIGGTGDDIYIADNTTDIITENANEGIDTIQSSVTYTIATLTKVENLILTGTAAINGTGNVGNNIITGNSGNNTLNGGAGTDTLIGSTGDDIYIVDSATDIITENVGEGTDTIQSSVTYTIATLTNFEKLTLTGTTAINGTGNAANNVITGNSGNNTLNAGAGNDTLNGGAGIDSLVGGTGDDIYIVDSATDIIAENVNEGTDTIQSSVTYTIATLTNVENLTLTGTTAINGTGNAANNVITGNSGNNTLNAGAGNDTLNGGAGIDSLVGGTGDDIYIVDSATDIIAENVNEGTDTIQSSVTYTIATLTNVENLTLTGTTAINGTGNAANNVITGNSVNNTLDGGVGNDTLDGGAGKDTLIGGLGDDIYIVDNTTDIITENANEGTDTIQSSVTYSIAANVENLTLTGTTAINGTGNAGNNIITGNNANNVIIGNAGNDTLDGGDGSDALIGGTGNDIYLVNSTTDTITENANEGTDTIQSSVTFTIATLTNVENLTLTGTTAINGTGNAGNNIITGNGVNNTLDGGAGIDTLIGGTGDDIYIVDSITDIITENANEGTDTIQSSVTFTIATLTNVENLTLTGTTAINGTGNAGNNIITGNSANNTLTGGLGKDTLTGGLGVDRFDYRTLADSVFSNFDVITDFSTANHFWGDDRFLVSTARSGFSNAGTVATLDTNGIAAKLTTAAFTANSAAQFSFGSRSFVALNDATAGFSATTDAIIEVTGLTGTLGLNNFTTSLV
jgi:Ca2+-binding RTX toxin-like protein